MEVTPKYEFWAGNGQFKQFMEKYLNLHQKWPYDGSDEVHGHGLIETDEALGGVFAERRRNLLDYRHFCIPHFSIKNVQKNCIAFLDPPENE